MRARSFVRTAVPAAALAGLAACSSVLSPLIRPDVKTDVVEMEGGNWTLDPAHASLLFKIDHLGYSTYVGRFERFDMRLDGVPNRPAKASVEATVDMSSLNVANPEFAETLMGPDWLDAAGFPQARFQSTRVLITGETQATLEGILTLHGRTAPLVLDVTFNGAAHDKLRGADIAGFSATANLNRSDFGVSKFSGLLTDTVRLEIEAELIRTRDVP